MQICHVEFKVSAIMFPIASLIGPNMHTRTHEDTKRLANLTQGEVRKALLLVHYELCLPAITFISTCPAPSTCSIHSRHRLAPPLLSLNTLGTERLCGGPGHVTGSCNSSEIPSPGRVKYSGHIVQPPLVSPQSTSASPSCLFLHLATPASAAAVSWARQGKPRQGTRDPLSRPIAT